jgi:filamin
MSYYGGGGPHQPNQNPNMYASPYNNDPYANLNYPTSPQQQQQPQYYDDYYYNDQEQPEFDKTEEEIDEEMQRELAEDAPWKKIQQNTFTRWANEHLKLVNRRIEDLQWDMADGLNLIALLEVLSHKKLPRYNKKPMFRSQKLENISVALDFLENVEHIRLVNIDSTHLVDGKTKLILGLIWTLILHYSITMPMWEGEEQDPSKRGKNSTPKQKLMDWINSHMPPDMPISNFTTDWNNGRAIGALVDSCAPGLYPDWQNNDPRNRANNAKEAMELAEEWLGIPQLITPDDMTNPKIDEQSMMTYLSQYPNAKLKPNAPIKPRSAQPAQPSRVRCYGKGIEPTGNLVDHPAKFNVETLNAGNGDVEVIVLNPKGQKEPVSINQIILFYF